jgi:hypothetical protein
MEPQGKITFKENIVKVSISEHEESVILHYVNVRASKGDVDQSWVLFLLCNVQNFLEQIQISRKESGTGFFA